MSHRAGESGEITIVTTSSIQDKQCEQVAFDFGIDILNVGDGVLWRAPNKEPRFRDRLLVYKHRHSSSRSHILDAESYSWRLH
jgi:hypothetical protein